MPRITVSLPKCQKDLDPVKWLVLSFTTCVPKTQQSSRRPPQLFVEWEIIRPLSDQEALLMYVHRPGAAKIQTLLAHDKTA